MENTSILVVDDEQANLMAIMEVLQGTGENYKIFNAINGKIACDIALKKNPDLIIIDWEMPVMSGIGAIRFLRAQETTQDIPIIMSTGMMTSAEHLKTAMEAGATDFIRKPMERLELIARVNAALKLSFSIMQIKKQALELHKQNQSIKSSIEYAQRIQFSLLPDKKQLSRIISDNFIYYKPRNIVSGDFFWFYTKRKEVLITVVDCTGHGVPGAFMSILAWSALSQIVRDFGDIDTDLILSELNERINAALKQGYGSFEVVPPMDGMEIVLCKIDLQKNQLSFSGAGRPIIIVRDKEIIEHKGVSYPIGGTSQFYENAIYKKIIIDIKPNDMVYLFSDGAQDQFGGPKSRKLGSKNLKKLFVDLSHLPCEEQCEAINDYLTNWQGESPQTDDICILGIRI